MKKMVILSGLSGGGKTQASNLLEDMGYRCIDQYPSELLGDFIKLIQNDTNNKYTNIVLTIPIVELDKYDSIINNSDIKPIIILLVADKETIINRYKFTRRVHPLIISNKADSLSEAIDIEKRIFDTYSKKNVIVIDTTDQPIKETQQKLEKAINNEDAKKLSLTFKSFGYKNGIPDDADLIIDARFLDNPFYVPKLKNKTGNDKAVKDFVLNNSLTQKFLKKTISYIDFVVKSYPKDVKRHLTICVGCTGGQHRSVVIANYLFDYFKKKYLCYLNHKEMD